MWSALQVIVVGQVLPVLTSIRLQLTSTRISLQPNHIDFGECNLGEKTGVTVQVTNHSALPQKFGKLTEFFLGYPGALPSAYCHGSAAAHCLPATAW